jgi:hypothetical protein
LDLTFKATFAIGLCIFLAVCNAQPQSHAQNVGGDYGRSWLNASSGQSPSSPGASSSGNSLWNWGGAPKGRIAVNGKLVIDPYYFWKSLNYSSGWLGQVNVDPKTGYPIYGFLDPYTGSPAYFYMDPNTGQPVFINSGLYGGYPYYDGISPYYSPNFKPPASTYYPWLSQPSALNRGSTPGYDYLGSGLGYF